MNPDVAALLTGVRRGVKWSKYPDDVLCAWVADMDLGTAPAVVARLRRLVEHQDFGYQPDPAPAVTEAAAAHPAAADPVGELEATAPGKTPALDQYTTCLTARAREGKVDPVIGRDAEIRQVIDILMRRRQNNPILTGEAGVGKTAVVEGLALRIAQNDVPDVLRSGDHGRVAAWRHEQAVERTRRVRPDLLPDPTDPSAS